jgi:hypothetical protein
MTNGDQGGKIEPTQQGPSLSERTHQEILDYFQVAEKNSQHPAIRDAAITLAMEKGRYQQTQNARLSPTLAMVIGVLAVIAACVASWLFFTHYTEHLASILTSVTVGLAIVVVCLLAMFSGHLSQANFVRVLEMVWSKFTDLIPKSSAKTIPNMKPESASSTSDNDGPDPG